MTKMLDCNDVMRQLWDYLDGELTGEMMQAMREHLAVCSHCQPKAEFEQSFLKAVSQARRTHSNPSGLSDRVREVLRRQGFTVE